MDDHRRRPASDRPSSGRRFGWQLEELVLSARQAPVRSSDRAPNARQSSVSASLSLSPCWTQTPREPGSFRLSFLLTRSTPPRERGFVNLFLLGTSKKTTISERGAVSSGPRERPRLTRVRRRQAAAVALPQRLHGVGALSGPAAAPAAHCGGPLGGGNHYRPGCVILIASSRRPRLRGVRDLGVGAPPSALVWQSPGCGAFLPLLFGSPAGCGARAVLMAPRAASVDPAGARRPDSALASCRQRDKREGRAGDVAASARTPAEPDLR